MTLKSRYSTIKSAISHACSAIGQPSDSVQLIAVSKKQPISHIRALHQLGQREFGESYVNEWVEKLDQLTDLEIEWHFIGPVQSNKSKWIAQFAHTLHSLDRLSLVNRLNQQRPTDKAPLEVYIQVNLSDEATKSGCSPCEIRQIHSAITEAPHLNFKGLMTLPERNPALAKRRFDTLVELAKQENLFPCGFSMGMSNDLALAIASGSTCIRVGTALFGERTS